MMRTCWRLAARPLIARVPAWRASAVASALPIWTHSPRRLASASSGGDLPEDRLSLASSSLPGDDLPEDEEDDTAGAEDEDDDSARARSDVQTLKSPTFQNWDVSYLKQLSEDGSLELRPSYQRGFKWTQLQASLWIESILRGFPCLPEVILLESDENEDGEVSYSVFDGQQRLTTIVRFMNGERGEHWKIPKKKTKKDSVFALEGLTMLTQFEGLTYKDLPKKQQNAIRRYVARCAVIPGTWEMGAYMEFFKRIQGGGTPMTDHELRRAISRGPFTELLDELAESDDVKRVLRGANLNVDETQKLLVRFFAMRDGSPHKFGKPALSQQGLVVMKKLNAEMKHWPAAEVAKNRDELVRPLKVALELAAEIFDDHAFRRPKPLVRKGVILGRQPKKVWYNSELVNPAIWDVVMHALSTDNIVKRKHDVSENKEAVRVALVELMQTSDAFTDNLKLGDVVRRTGQVFEELSAALDEGPTRDTTKVSAQTRKELIASARRAHSKPICPLCDSPLGPHDDHLHIDHVLPRARGGTSDLANLQVVHKWCNLRKSDSLPLAGPSA